MKKVLVISYYFPPMGMGGVQRTSKFVKYLSFFNWTSFVLTDSVGSYFAQDDILLKELDKPDIYILRTEGAAKNRKLNTKDKILYGNAKFRKVIGAIAQAFLIPDTKRFWKSKASKLGSKIIADYKIDLIYSTAPPYTDFLIGYELKKKFNLPLVIDYRDSWIDCPNNFYPTPFHRSANKKLEEKILRVADKIITINNEIKDLLIYHYPFLTDDKISIIPQGFDPDDFVKVETLEEKKNKFRITYSGSFLNYYTPEYFLKGLAKAKQLEPDLIGNVEACFIGTFPENYKKLISQFDLSGDVNMTGYINHKECISYLKNSHVLWMMINKTQISKIHSTGKLYEYFGAEKPVFAFVPDGAAKQSLNGHNAVRVCEPDDIDSIAKYIVEFYNLFESGLLPVPDKNFISKYDRKYLTGVLVDNFNAVLSK